MKTIICLSSQKSIGGYPNELRTTEFMQNLRHPKQNILWRVQGYEVTATDSFSLHVYQIKLGESFYMVSKHPVAELAVC